MVHPALRRARILECLSDDEIEGMAMLGEIRAFGSSESVFRGDEPADSLFIVLEGEVSSQLKEKGQSFELAQCAPGDHFGLVALLGGQLCYTQAIGRTRGRVFVLSSMGCAALLGRIPRSQPQSVRPSRPSAGSLQIPQGSSTQPAPDPDFLRIRSISGAVAGVAHELNTPLGVIENAASFVSEQLSSEAIAQITSDASQAAALSDIAEACALIRKNVAHAANIVSSFKKLSIGQLAEARERVDLLRVIQQALGLFRTKALSALPPGMNTSHGLSGAQRLLMRPGSGLDVDVQCELSERARSWEGFPSLFSRVLLNLLTNIDRYAYPGFSDGGRVDVRLSESEVQPGVPGFVVTVSDYGRGIPERDLPRIFDPFFTTGRTKGGTGLGLAMVHNLVTHGFGGSVRVRSSIGQGTTFELHFPKQAPNHESDRPSQP